MWQLGWITANDGNVSVKLEDGTFFATPTGMSKSFITPDKLVRINEKRRSAGRCTRPASFFRNQNAFVLLPGTSGCGRCSSCPSSGGNRIRRFANKALDEYTMIESVIAIGSVPVTPYGTPSTDEVPEAIKPYLQEHDVMLLQNHGALTVGADLITAYYRMETLELFAKISLNAHLLGGAQEISRENIDRLCSMRAQYGVTGKHPGYKKYPNGQN